MEEGQSRHEGYQLYLKHKERMNSHQRTRVQKQCTSRRGAGGWGGGGALLLVAGGGVIPRPGLKLGEKPGVTIERVEQQVAREQASVRF
jgi:hypothetical protein